MSRMNHPSLVPVMNLLPSSEYSALHEQQSAKNGPRSSLPPPLPPPATCRFAKFFFGLLAIVLVVCISAQAAPATGTYLGDMVFLSGYSYGSDTVYLFLTGPNLPARVKVALTLQGRNGGRSRRPMIAPSGDDVRRIREALERVNLAAVA